MSYDFDFNNYKKYGGRDYPDMNSEDYDYEFSDDFDFDDIYKFFGDWSILHLKEGQMDRYALPKMLWTAMCQTQN